MPKNDWLPLLVDELGAKVKIIIRGEELEEYGADRGLHDPSLPDAVAIPQSAEEVSAVVRFCHEHNVYMTVRGAGTGLEGGCIPYQGGLVISTAELKRIDIDDATNTVWVGAGVLKLELDHALAKRNLLFGPDPSSNPSLGGMASTSGSGMTTLKYGTTRENVYSLLVVTPEGHLIQTRRPVRKSSTGLDLTQLYCGSEGTLGVIVELLLRVQPRPSLRSGAILVFDETAAAVQTIVEVRESLSLATLTKCELLNAEGVRCGNRFYKTQLVEAPTLLLEFTDNDAERMRADWERFFAVACRYAVIQPQCQYLSSGAELDEVWEARRGCHFAAHKYRGSRDKVFSSDVCVPLTKLTECVAETEKDFAASNFPCFICAHIADGNFHCLVPFADDTEKQQMFQLLDRLIERALKMGGTVSGEHGIGVGKIKYLLREHGEEHCQVQRRIKQALDPRGLLNPGKFYAPMSKL